MATKQPKSLYEKLFALQQEANALTKDTKGYNYKYFDINKMLKELKPLFAKYNLLLLQPITDDRVCTRIIDVDSGDEVTSDIALTIGAKPQDLGSEISYFRRYNLQSLLGLEAEDDDAARTNNRTKPSLQGDGYAKALDAVRNGSYKASDIIAKYSLTPQQVKELNSASKP